MKSPPVVDIFDRPLVFINDIAYCKSFNDMLVRVFRNDSRHNSSRYGYMIINPDTHVIVKYCRACSFSAVKRAVILN